MTFASGLSEPAGQFRRCTTKLEDWAQIVGKHKTTRVFILRTLDRARADVVKTQLLLAPLVETYSSGDYPNHLELTVSILEVLEVAQGLIEDLRKFA